MSKLIKFPPNKPPRRGQMFVTHVFTAQGIPLWFWVVTDGPELPTRGGDITNFVHGPYETEREAINASNLAMRAYLGPQCPIEDRSGWPEKTHPTVQ